MLAKYLPKRIKSIHIVVVCMLPLVMMHPSTASVIVAIIHLVALFILRGVAQEEGKNGQID